MDDAAVMGEIVFERAEPAYPVGMALRKLGVWFCALRPLSLGTQSREDEQDAENSFLNSLLTAMGSRLSS